MPSDHDAAAAQVRSVRPLLAAARSRRGGGEQEVEASRKRPRRGAAIRASQAWTLDHSTASLVFEPLEGGACEAAVIWLHGLDDTPEPWANRLAAERRRRPRWKWIHLRAPERAITCYKRKVHSAWGDFTDPEKLCVGSRDHESSDPKGWFAESVALVHATVFGLLSEGLAPKRVAIVGFSQGAALAAEASLTLGVPLAGWIMLSGWLPLRARGALARSANGRAGARVLVCHSTADEEVDVGCARLARKLLVAAGSSVDFKTLCDELHVASAPHGQRNALAFLDDVLSLSGGGAAAATTNS